MASKKSSPSRLNVLYLILTLKKYSSSSNPISLVELTQKANQEFYKSFGPADSEKGLDSGTVGRIMDTLVLSEKIGYQNIPMSDYKDPSGCGHNIYCVMKTGNPDNPWAFYQSPDNDDERGPKKYYYYESVFSDAELTTLIDSVETYNYFSQKNISTLVAKLLGLRPTSEYLKQYDEYEGKRLKDTNSRVLSNIDEFNRIINANQFAQIEYCSYTYNAQSKTLELSVRPKYPRIVRPLTMMWSNGYYYLVALFAGGYTPANLRLDRISSISACAPTEKMLQDFKVDMSLETTVYRLNHPVMYGGELKHIKMLYNSDLATGMNNAITDTFGKLTNIQPATADELQTYLGTKNPDGKWLVARIHATEGGVELFATQYCRHCRIISPESLATKVHTNLTEGLKLYQS